MGFGIKGERKLEPFTIDSMREPDRFHHAVHFALGGTQTFLHYVVGAPWTVPALRALGCRISSRKEGRVSIRAPDIGLGKGNCRSACRPLWVGLELESALWRPQRAGCRSFSTGLRTDQAMFIGYSSQGSSGKASRDARLSQRTTVIDRRHDAERLASDI